MMKMYNIMFKNKNQLIKTMILKGNHLIIQISKINLKVKIKIMHSNQRTLVN